MTRLPRLLDTAGLVLLALAAGILAVPAGLATAGVGCLLLSWRLAGERYRRT